LSCAYKGHKQRFLLKGSKSAWWGRKNRLQPVQKQDLQHDAEVLKFMEGIIMVINHNMSSMYSNRTLGVSSDQLQNNIEKLSSGQRINRAGDDASGLAVSEKMRSQIRGLNQANRNIQNGVSFIQSTEGYLGETTDILQRIRELAVQSSNGIYSDEDRMQIQVEVSQLVSEVDRIASQAQFNGMNMLTGAFAKETGTRIMQFQIGANVDQNERVYIGTMTAQALGLKGAQGSDEQISIDSPDKANMAIASIDNALLTVSKQRADLGAYQNRFEMASNGVGVAAENLQAAESRIRDTDMASEMVEYTKNQILTQSGTAMLAQANSQSQNVLALLR
jgi:flagellin